MRVLMTLTHRASVKMLIALGEPFLSAQLKLGHFAATLRYNIITTFTLKANRVT